MTYRINARLEQGLPSLTLHDATTGEQRLHWRGDKVVSGENEWRDLFKRLVLLSCADQLSLDENEKLWLLNGEVIDQA